ncbi:unnamed protein product [Adineta ricciae]|uniref:Ubiquitin carboxyl-terminal hydrolase n=1 Tax=Adineta ricciae TaxID=249248 RepID=A0A814ZIU0_ADIRI|nr:unnamed protein product [Adineta ricciae]
MTTSTKEKVGLYIANDLEELNKRADDNPSIQKAKLSNCSQITHIIETTWQEAKKAELSCDEERAYVLYMRLFACFTALKQAKDVANNQSSVQYYQKGALIWLEKADQLSESLKSRYDEKNAVKLEEDRKNKAEIDEENNLTTSIKSKLLYAYMNTRKKNILLIDMRSTANYDQSHMKTAACIHIPCDLMKGKGWTSWGVESALTNSDAASKFKQRATYDYVVLFDEGSYERDLSSDHCLQGLKQAIYSLDRDVKLKHEPLILEGGYQDWSGYYPTENTAPLPSNKSNNGLQSFEIAYPDDVIQPEQVPSDAASDAQPEAGIFMPAVIPQVDRTRKPIQNPKLEQDETQIKPIQSDEPLQPSPVAKEQPQIPDRSIKPITPAGPSPVVNQEQPTIPTTRSIPPRPAPSASSTATTSEVSKQPKPIDTNQENIPPKFSVPNRETLPIYRPFNRAVPVSDTNAQFQKKFDAVTGRKIILDTKTNQYVSNVPENDSTRLPPASSQTIPTINRDTKPVLTEQKRRQIAYDYRALTDSFQINRRTGLKNLGNSCYMNSIIQSLSFNFRFTNYFLTGEFYKDINQKNKFGSGGLVVKEWFNLVYALWCSQFSQLSPYPFKNVVGSLQRAYLGTQQQDAHEFLVFLLDSLHEDLNQATRPRLEEIKAENYKTDQQLADATKQAFHLHNKSIVIDLFYGLFKSTTICLSCSYNSIRFEAFAIISVPIPPVRQCSLDECMDLFREFEHLTGEERYECSKCKRLSDKKRRLDIWELPKIFIVHFKRFRLQQMRYIKNESLIRYPTASVDFSRWTHNRSASKYSLVSVVNHFGSMNSGHYTSFCKDGNQWYYCDDESIRAADIRELENNVHAYLLFYSSIAPQQLSLPLISN